MVFLSILLIRLISLHYFILSLKEKIESSTDVLESILKPVVHGDEEISWPPQDPMALVSMERVSAAFPKWHGYLVCQM